MGTPSLPFWLTLALDHHLDLRRFLRYAASMLDPRDRKEKTARVSLESSFSTERATWRRRARRVRSSTWPALEELEVSDPERPAAPSSPPGAGDAKSPVARKGRVRTVLVGSRGAAASGGRERVTYGAGRQAEGVEGGLKTRSGTESAPPPSNGSGGKSGDGLGAPGG